MKAAEYHSHYENHLDIDSEDEEDEESERNPNNSITVNTSGQKKGLVDYSFLSDEENY